jgi:hypothetical protein
VLFIFNSVTARVELVPFPCGMNPEFFCSLSAPCPSG